MSLEFTWSEEKSRTNLKKHGISFDEASGVFLDERALLIRDLIHSVGEERFVLLGRSTKGAMLIVVHLYWEDQELIRIISARRATRAEHLQYFAR
ncbi:hypothetical protein D3C87_1688830 [compost metagenome]